MAADNLGADLDDIQVDVEPHSFPTPRIIIQQASVDLEDEVPAMNLSSFDEIEPIFEEPAVVTSPETEEDITDEAETSMTSLPEPIPQRPKSALGSREQNREEEKTTKATKIPPARVETTALQNPRRRKFFSGLVRLAARIGGVFERAPSLGISSLSMARRWHRICKGGFRKKQIRDIKCKITLIGPDNQFRVRMYYREPILESPDEGPRPVIIYVHGNLAFASARSYDSFYSKLCHDLLLRTNCVVVGLDLPNVPDRKLVDLSHDIIEFASLMCRGELDVDFDTYRILIDKSRIVLAGDGDGALLAFTAGIELGDYLCGLLLISPPLQALTKEMFESHVKYEKVNCSRFGHRLEVSLPYYAGLRLNSEVNNAKDAILAERHVQADMRARLLKRLFPTFEKPFGLKSEAPSGIYASIQQICVNASIWPMLMRNKDLARMPYQVMMQACEVDTLFDEQRLFAKRLTKVLGGRFRFSVVEKATHSEAVHVDLLKTQSSRIAYREVLEFIRHCIVPKLGPDINSRRKSAPS